MHRNIWLLKIILPTSTAWFWLGTWLLYYLRYTNYAGVGLIEAVQILCGFLLEIPTGAIADLLGKKRTLLLAFIGIFLGNIFMAMSTSLFPMIGSILFIAVGFAGLSGTADALLFDSLKELNKDHEFEKHLSIIEMNKLLAMAAASLIGGFLYRIDGRLPFICTAIAAIAGTFLCFFLKEPHIDSDVFNFRSYMQTMKLGVVELFNQTTRVRQHLLELLLFMLTLTILYEVLDNALSVEFGMTSYQLGAFYAIISIISAVVTFIFEKLKTSRVGERLSFLFIILSSLCSPLYSIWTGAVSLLLRNILYPYLRIRTSKAINDVVSSRYRATALSTFTMVSKVPYVLFAYAVGSQMDTIGSARVTFLVALLCLIAYGTLHVLFLMVKKDVTYAKNSHNKNR